MDGDHRHGEWTHWKRKLRERWGKLTDQDLESIGARKDQLLGALRERYGLEAERAMNEVDRWIDTLQEKFTESDPQ